MEPGGGTKRVVVLRELTGEKRHFPMLVEDLLSLIRTSVIKYGIVTARFRVKRTGRKNYIYTIVKVD